MARGSREQLGLGEVPFPDFEKILADQILEDREQWPKNMKIWASELGVALGPQHDGCQLAFWLKCRDAARRDPKPGELLMWAMGDAAERVIIDLLAKALPKHGWEIVGTQERVQKYGASGRNDLRIRHPETGTVRVIDVKSKRGNAFGYLTSPKAGNKLQVQFYVDGQEADAGDLLYVDREGANFVRHFPIDKEDERPRKAAEILHQIRDNEERPEPLTPKLKRVVNKGPDSVYLNYPWQVEWCDLKECPCRKRCGKLPDGIAAKITKKGALQMVEGYEKYGEMVLELLTRDYPDEDFFLEAK